MPEIEEILNRFRVPHNKKIALSDYDTAWDGDDEIPKAERKKRAASILSEDVSDLAAAQEKLWASDSWSVLIVLQAMDAAGKDGTIKHVMSGVNPQGCHVTSFKQPSPQDLDHTYLWRYQKALPSRGMIGIFNRSYYEEVLVVRVHPEWIGRQRIPNVRPNALPDDFWKHRFEDINAMERHLTRNGTVVLKFFLHISRDEQRKRFLKRLKDPEKHWKFSPADLAERAYWDDYQAAYQEAINATSTKWAPWHIVPADHKWVSRAVVSRIITTTVESLGVQFPSVTPEQTAGLDDARRALEAEND